MALGERRRDPGVRAVAPRNRLAAVAATLVLILAACGGTTASPSAPSAPVSTPEGTAETSASPESTASQLETPQPTQAAVGECTPGPATSLSSDWVSQASLSGDYRFSRPADWADLSAGLTLPSNVSVSPETFTESGLSADARQQVDAVRSFDGNTLVTAWVIEGVSTPTEQLFARELAWLETQPQIKEVLDTSFGTCIGGSKARGFGSTWETADGDRTIVIFMLQRNGKMYEVQLTAVDSGQAATLDEVLNSWEFTEPLGPIDPPTDLDDEFAATDFKVIGTAAELDREGGHPNEADFQSVFPADLGRIHVIYELDDGVADTVNFSWARDGREIVTSTFEYEASLGFAWGGFTPGSSGRFIPGSYTVTLSLVNSGDTITVPFTVE